MSARCNYFYTILWLRVRLWVSNVVEGFRGLEGDVSFLLFEIQKSCRQFEEEISIEQQADVLRMIVQISSLLEIEVLIFQLILTLVTRERV